MIRLPMAPLSNVIEATIWPAMLMALLPPVTYFGLIMPSSGLALSVNYSFFSDQSTYFFTTTVCDMSTLAVMFKSGGHSYYAAYLGFTAI